MSQTGKLVIWGAVTASAMLAGAMQLASGHDLASELSARAPEQALASVATNVNRASKTDRAASIAEATPTQTVSIKLAAFADTS